MSTFYICEPGIKLWEQPTYTTAPGFITFSFLGPSILEAWATWRKVTNSLAPEWPIVMKWRTVGYSLEQYKTQEVRLRKEIEKTLTDEDLIKKIQLQKYIHIFKPAIA